MTVSTYFYRAVYLIFKPILWLLFPFRAHGLENLPKDRPVVLCANHAHAIDPFLICLALPLRTPVRIMAKKELMDKPLLGWFLGRLGAFGVDRGHSDLAAIKTALRAVRDGKNLLVFPEGTRVRHEGDVQPKGGVAMIAMRTGAPLLPVYAGERHKLFHMTHIVFGEPLEAKAAARHATAAEYQACADEIVRRAYSLGREWKR